MVVLQQWTVCQGRGDVSLRHAGTVDWPTLTAQATDLTAPVVPVVTGVVQSWCRVVSRGISVCVEVTASVCFAVLVWPSAVWHRTSTKYGRTSSGVTMVRLLLSNDFS